MAPKKDDDQNQGPPTLEELEDVIDDGPGDETVAEALAAAMEEEGVNSAGEKIEDQESSDEDGGADDEVGEKTDEQSAESEGEGEGESEGEGEAEEGDSEGDEDKGTEALDPPPEWDESEHETFHALTPEGQKLMMDKIGDATAKAGESESTAERYSWLDEAVKTEVVPGVTRAQYWEQNGWDAPTAVKMVLSLADRANADPAGFIKHISESRGIDLVALAGVTPAEGEDDADDVAAYSDDPGVQVLLNKVSVLEERLAAAEGKTTEIATRDEQARISQETAMQGQVNEAVNAFAEEKTDGGKPAHPHFSQVRKHMGLYMREGIAPDMKSAYDMACRAHPEVSAKIGRGEKARNDREAAKAAREKAAKARETGSSISGDSDSNQEPALTGDLREDLRTAFAEAGAFD